MRQTERTNIRNNCSVQFLGQFEISRVSLHPVSYREKRVKIRTTKEIKKSCLSCIQFPLAKSRAQFIQECIQRDDQLFQI